MLELIKKLPSPPTTVAIAGPDDLFPNVFAGAAQKKAEALGFKIVYNNKYPDTATDVSSIKMISYGAAAAPTELIARAMEQWPDAGFANVFGQTETLGAYTTLSPADHRDPRRLGQAAHALGKGIDRARAQRRSGLRRLDRGGRDLVGRDGDAVAPNGGVADPRDGAGDEDLPVHRVHDNLTQWTM